MLAAATTARPVDTPNASQPATTAENAIAETARNAAPSTNRLSSANRRLSFLTSPSLTPLLAASAVSLRRAGRGTDQEPVPSRRESVLFRRPMTANRTSPPVMPREKCLLDHICADVPGG